MGENVGVAIAAQVSNGCLQRRAADMMHSNFSDIPRMTVDLIARFAQLFLFGNAFTGLVPIKTHVSRGLTDLQPC
jgi:hypothetical protein